MSFCSACGQELIAGSRSCSSCGAVTPVSGTDLPAGDPTNARATASVGRRLLAGAADLIPLMVLSSAALLANRRGMILSRPLLVALIGLPVLLLLTRDAVNGQSPGKMILRLQVRDRTTGSVGGIPDSILRNLPLVPLLFAALGRRYGALVAAAILVVHTLLIAVGQRGLTDVFGGTKVTER